MADGFITTRTARRGGSCPPPTRRRPEMGRIIISDNVSIDGVIQDPAGDEGFERGGWVGLIKDRPGANKLALDEALATEALLLGRRSYEWMAGRWPSPTG
jgi:dihydrofolate reductase